MAPPIYGNTVTDFHSFSCRCQFKLLLKERGMHAPNKLSDKTVPTARATLGTLEHPYFIKSTAGQEQNAVTLSTRRVIIPELILSCVAIECWIMSIEDIFVVVLQVGVRRRDHLRMTMANKTQMDPSAQHKQSGDGAIAAEHESSEESSQSLA